LLFGHWGPGNRTEFLPEALLYAQAGAVSLLVDYPWVRPAQWRRSLKLADDPENDHRAFIQTVVDLRRGFDLLCARADVDKDRLAYVGHSYGAQWGAILSATEKRLKTAVLIGGIPDSAAIWRDGNEPIAVDYRASTPKEKQEAYLQVMDRTAAVRYVPHAQMPLFFQFARHERYFDESAMNRYYAAAKEPKAIKWYDTGHDLNDVQTLADRAKWLHDKISIKPIGRTLATALEGK
jgi:pimeloyl-ACP methyl ester carboxylesterase